MECLFDSLPKTLTLDERDQVIQLIRLNADIFAKSRYDIGKTTLLEAEIQTGSSPPLSEPLRCHPKAHLELIDKAVSDLQAAGLVEESTSPWSSNLVVIKRDDGVPRVTVDLRKLNAATSRESFPMPNVNESLDFLSQSQYISVLDMTQSYFHVP